MGKDGEGYLVMVGDQQSFFLKTSGLCADQMFNRRVSEMSQREQKGLRYRQRGRSRHQRSGDVMQQS
jgi:hypothetical protein